LHGADVKKQLLFTAAIAPDVLEQIRSNYPQYDVGYIDEKSMAVRAACWVFIDWLLPQMSGLELCRRLRALPGPYQPHITMILSEANEDDSRLALKSGADDYMVGPLTYATLKDRLMLYGVNADPTASNHLVVSGDLHVDYTALCVRYRGKLITIAPNEMHLLARFIENSDRVLSREEIIGLLGKDIGEIDPRTVDVWVGRLRRNLARSGVPLSLRAVRGNGYVWDAQMEVDQSVIGDHY
jgi:two-component system, OmpR family, phosphate regulon response regulator PhoB